MGGGATMRAVGKAAGIGLVNSGIRGRLPEHPVSAATRSVTRPVAAIGATSSAESVKPIEAYDDASPMQKTVCDFDDWDFADFREEIAVASDDKKFPRVVFGGAPTLEEAKEATFELKEVLEKEYLSSTTSPKFGNTSQDSSLSCLESSAVEQSKACLTTEIVVPTHALQAFKFLNESPAVQAVVASIASDPNVWNSVLRNPTLQDYLQTQKIDLPIQNLYPSVVESFGDAHSHADKSPVILETSSETGDADDIDREFHPEDILMNVWNNTKEAVVGMMNNLSDFFQSLFGGHPAEKVSPDQNAGASFTEKALGPSLMGLVIMVIMVVVLKRP